MVIKAEKLNLDFETNDGVVHALRDLDLEIVAGEFVSFIGSPPKVSSFKP